MDVDLNSGEDADLRVRYVDANNGYKLRLESGGDIELFKVHKGQTTSLDSDTYTTAASVTVKVKLDGTTIQAWVDDTLEIDTTDSTHAAGGVAFAGVQPKFDDLYVFHDINTNGSYDAGTDELFRNENFGSTSTTFAHDDAGNLVDDGTFVYVYDAWNP